jgi:hypothetical protein
VEIQEARRRDAAFRALHDKPEVLMLPNPWDAGSTRLFENMGSPGLATTSAGLAFSLGRRDGDGNVDEDDHVSTRSIAARGDAHPDRECERHATDSSPTTCSTSNSLRSTSGDDDITSVVTNLRWRVRAA